MIEKSYQTIEEYLDDVEKLRNEYAEKRREIENRAATARLPVFDLFVRLFDFDSLSYAARKCGIPYNSARNLNAESAGPTSLFVWKLVNALASALSIGTRRDILDQIIMETKNARKKL